VSRAPLGLRAARTVIRLAGAFVPRERRGEWQRLWSAELEHRWQVHRQRPARDLVRWSLGAFSHAWYVLRTEFTMDSILQDVRYALRSLRSGKGLVAVAVISLALGIGASASIFSVVDVLMFRPLPYEDSERVVRIYTTNEERGWTEVSVTVPDFLDFRDQSEVTDIAASSGESFNLSGGDRPERVVGRRVSYNFFRVLGMPPVRGRSFTEGEERAGQNRVVIITDGFWHRHFGADPAVLDETVLLNGEPHTIVGVLSPDFWSEYHGVDVWVPFGVTGEESRASYYLSVVGRVQPTATVDRARVEISQIANQIAAAYPQTSSGNGAHMLTLQSNMTDEGVRSGSLIGMTAVAFVLLIACANVANLLLTRAAGRDREVALRGALGAGRIRIAQQFLAEAVVISLLGGALGLVFAAFGIRGLISIIPPDFERIDAVGLDGRVLLFTGVVTIATGLIFGMAPVLQSAKTNFVDSLKEGGRSGGGVTSGRFRKALVVAEVSLAVTLLVASALLVQGFNRLQGGENGFDETDVLTFRITLPANEFPDTTALDAFYTSLRPRIQALPGVVSASATSILPWRGNSGTWYWLSEQEPLDSEKSITNYRYILPEYFEALDVPLLRGRTFTGGDRPTTARVVVINEAMVARHWADADPIGQRIHLSSGVREIVGVVADTREYGSTDAPDPMMYMATVQGMNRSMSWVVETSTPPAALADAVRAEVAAVNPNLPVFQVMGLDLVIRDALQGDAIMPRVMGVLALVALVLSVGGVYGVMAYSVSQRTRELGIRMALGAHGRSVMSMVVRQGTMLAGLGVGVGILLALGVSRGLSLFLYGVNPFHPPTFVGVAVFLLGAGVAASYFPARRATKVDPMLALRTE
jgi:putative ABC transport system permease protein